MNTTETKANTNNKTSNERRRALAQQLHNAAQVGNIQEIQSIFIKHPELSIDSHRKGNTALHTALYHNQDGLLLDYLLECGASVNSPNSKGYTPLDLSIMYCKGGKAAEKLIGAGAQWKETYCCSDTTNESSKNGGGGGGCHWKGCHFFARKNIAHFFSPKMSKLVWRPTRENADLVRRSHFTERFGFGPAPPLPPP